MKRLFDLFVAIIGFALLAPVFVAVAMLVKREDGGAVFFRQRRVGRNGCPFEIVKFRTMRPDVGGAPITVGGDTRVTRIGRALRRWKLDELPQLWNVLKGDMSLVGPRPEVPEYVTLYPPEAREILRVRPGITGLAQLAGIDEEERLRAVSDPERFYREVLLPQKLEIDLGYARQAGWATDVVVLWRTLWRLAGAGGGSNAAA